MAHFEDASAITTDAYEHIASAYAEQHTIAQVPSFWRERMQRFASVLRASPMYQSNPSLPVLDIGCGPGRDSLLLAQMGFSVLAGDLSEAMLEEARKRCQGQARAEQITFRQMDMHALDLPDTTCVGVWASASFLHIPKSENLVVMQELVRILMHGGPLLLTVKDCDRGEAERYEQHKASGTIRFFARYRGSELWALLEQAGVQVMEILTDVDTRFSDLQRWLGALAVKN